MKNLALFTTIILFLLSCKQEKNNTGEQTDPLYSKAKAIHEKVITLDTHCDINVDNFTTLKNYTQNLDTQVTLPKMKSGGLDVAWFIVYTRQDSLTPQGYEKAYKNAITKFEAIYRLVDDIAPNEIELAVTSAQVREIHSKGKKVAMIGIENGYPVGTEIENVQRFYDLGGRYMSLSHQGHSQLSDSNTGENDSIWLHNGLSELGKEVIVEMNRVGMMIDVSHPSKEAMRQMIELTKAPIIASHSSARALCDHSRNLDDEQLQWMKENGGVVQTVAFRTYLNTEKSDLRIAKEKEIAKEIADSMGGTWLERKEVAALQQEEKDAYLKFVEKLRPMHLKKMNSMKNLPPRVDVVDYVNHIDYMVEKMGIDHVGISSDFDGGGGIEGWSDASETFNVTLELVKRGYTEAQIEKLWSGNLLRVLDEVQQVAKEIQSKKSV
ncbi:dipeptidase [Aquimarina sp. 2-A2]|uniref:dipeptidase n=1 Tax=Aquimarina sp. 2-A2 TaxID=3382644 RepID=UPI00387F26B6